MAATSASVTAKATAYPPAAPAGAVVDPAAGAGEPQVDPAGQPAAGQLALDVAQVQGVGPGRLVEVGPQVSERAVGQGERVQVQVAAEGGDPCRPGRRRRT